MTLRALDELQTLGINEITVKNLWPRLVHLPRFEDNYGDEDVRAMASAFPDGANKAWGVDEGQRIILLFRCQLDYQFGPHYAGDKKHPTEALVYIYQRYSDAVHCEHYWRIRSNGFNWDAIAWHNNDGANLHPINTPFNSTFVKNLLAGKTACLRQVTMKRVDASCRIHDPPVYGNSKVDFENIPFVNPDHVYSTFVTLKQA